MSKDSIKIGQDFSNFINLKVEKSENKKDDLDLKKIYEEFLEVKKDVKDIKEMLKIIFEALRESEIKDETVDNGDEPKT